MSVYAELIGVFEAMDKTVFSFVVNCFRIKACENAFVTKNYDKTTILRSETYTFCGKRILLPFDLYVRVQWR